MDTDNHRSTSVPIAVTLRSEQEQSKGVGMYTARDDGFTLEFALGDGSYTVEKTRDGVKLDARGTLSYSIDLCRGGAAELSSPFGSLSYTVEPEGTDIKADGHGVEMTLRYALKNEAERIERAINIVATFEKTGVEL